MAATKNKPHKGLLKRVRITKSGFVKHKSANSKHLKSGKSPNRLRRLRKSRIASNAEMEQLELMLHRRVRGRDQPLTAQRRSPSPQERHAAEDAAAAEKKKK
jgi:large subunit ribosomal protein L35